MNDILKTVLSMTVSGSIIAVILIAARPLWKDRVSKTWQYYIWLIVIVRLLVQFSFGVNIPKDLFAPIAQVTDIPIVNSVGDYPSDSEKNINLPEVQQNHIEQAVIDNEVPDTKAYEFYVTAVQENIGILWFIGFSVLMMKKIISYFVYTRHIKSKRKSVIYENVLTIYHETCSKLGIKRKIGLYSHDTIPSPMLIGFVKPYILLPEAVLKETNGLQYILLHELTHYKRSDFLYKWLVQFTVCVHFFNPVVYFIRKAINKTCEFSCDEMVIKKLDEQGKIAYGTALIDTLALNAGFNQPAISFMLCEDAKIIKERLGAIMKYRKMNKFMLAMTMSLTIAICFSAMLTGAYAADPQHSMAVQPIPKPPVIGEAPPIAVTMPLPHKTQTETTAGKNNFGRGPYSLKAGTKYTIAMSWNGDGILQIYLRGDDGNSEAYTITSGNPLEITVSKDGIYRIEAKLDPDKPMTRIVYYFGISGENADLVWKEYDTSKWEEYYKSREDYYDSLGDFYKQKWEGINGEEYGKVGITVSGEAYYYNGDRVRIFMDMRTDNSFENFFVHTDGTVDIRVIRSDNGQIKAIERLDDKTAKEILDDMEERMKGLADTQSQANKVNPVYVSRSDSLIQNFANYKPYGVTYDAEQDAVYYNGERVKLFVDFNPNKEDGMTYAFNLCYRDIGTDSKLYLEAVKDNKGNIKGIQNLKNETALEILGEMKNSPKDMDNKKDLGTIGDLGGSESINKPEHILDLNGIKLYDESYSNGITNFLVMDATHIIESANITAKDLTKDKAGQSIKDWIAQCNKKQGAYILKIKTENGYDTYIYYNGGGRYPWNLDTDGETININLYNDTTLSTDEGYYLMHFTAPMDYKNMNIYLDGSKLSYDVVNRN